MKSEPRLIIVAGMHRSGTSTLIKGLEALGVDLGSDFNPVTLDNPKGYWEDREFHRLNDELLQALKHPWDDPGLIEEKAVLQLSRGGFSARALALVKERLRGKSLAGVKDPRFSLLLPFWKKVFQEAGISVSFVISFRNPLSVAESLSQRDAFPKSKALGLWRLYNASIASGTAGAPGVVVDYDELLDDPAAQLARVAGFLNLAVDEGILASFSSEFLEPSLRHTRFSGDDLRADPACDPVVFRMYEELRSRADSDPCRRFFRKIQPGWLRRITAPISVLKRDGNRLGLPGFPKNNRR